MKDLTKLHFTSDCGVKYNKTVILNQDPVFDFYLEHQDWFHQMKYDFDSSSMSYGYLENGYAYKTGMNNNQIERVVIEHKANLYQRIKLVCEYDGALFSGFQVQKSERSVQGEIEKVLSEIHNEPTKVIGASRTDAGVHALHQVIHFDTFRDDSKEKWLRYFRKRLPSDIYIKSLEFVHPLFHSRYDVVKKEYRYRINMKEYNPFMRHYEWFQEHINLAVLKQEVSSLIGTFDFTSFSKGEKEDKTRTIFEAYVEEHSDYIEIVFVGNGFLRYMIRLLVFALVQISQHKMKTTIKHLILDQSRTKTIHLAPASGLYLTKIHY